MYKWMYPLMVIILVSIIGIQQFHINRYNLWVSDDLKNTLAGVGMGILANETILSEIVQATEMTKEQADQIINHSTFAAKFSE